RSKPAAPMPRKRSETGATPISGDRYESCRKKRCTCSPPTSFAWATTVRKAPTAVTGAWSPAASCLAEPFWCTGRFRAPAESSKLARLISLGRLTSCAAPFALQPHPGPSPQVRERTTSRGTATFRRLLFCFAQGLRRGTPAATGLPCTAEVATMRHAFFALLIVGTSVVLSTGASAAERDWKVGLAQVKITPDKPVFLAGYASRNKPFERLESDLY